MNKYNKLGNLFSQLYKEEYIKELKDKIKQKDDLVIKLNKKIDLLNKQIAKEKEPNLILPIEILVKDKTLIPKCSNIRRT